MHKSSFKYMLIYILSTFSYLAIASDLDNNQVSFSGEFTPEKAMKSIFNNYDSKVGGSTWSPKNTCSTANIYESENYNNKNFLDAIEEDGNQSVAKAHSYLQYKANDKEKVYLVIETFINWCGACPALMGVALWEKSDNIWKLANITKCMVPLGSYGNLGNTTIKVVKVSNLKYGLLVSKSYNDHKLAMLIIEDEILKVAFHKVVGNGNIIGRGSCHDYDTYCWSYYSDIKFKKYKDSKYFDIIQKTTGTKHIGDNREKRIKIVIPYNNSFAYRYNEGKYTKIN